VGLYVGMSGFLIHRMSQGVFGMAYNQEGARGRIVG
jgi:hypothetical protein